MNTDAPNWTPLDPESSPVSAADISAERTPGDVPPVAPRRRLRWAGRLSGRRTPASRRLLSVGVATAAGLGTMAGLFALSNALGVQAQTLRSTTVTIPSDAETPSAPSAPVLRADRSDDPRPATFTFRDHARHPDRLFRPYFAGTVPDGDAFHAGPLVQPFRSFLDLMTRRQAEDDNFTVRVLDAEGETTVEVLELREMRRAYQDTGTADWDAVDRERRRLTDSALRRYEQQGRARSSLAVRWGRADQVREARERDAPFVMHEIALAQRMGLSLLVTEIGSVETFNNDKAVSSVGARSRYQMMPDLIRRSGLRRYTLPTTGGRRVTVAEEWHPLLTMEPAFRLAKAYANATGGEITGVSAYHTGPGNLFSLYRAFLASGGRYASAGAPVLDAYVWGVTDGYPVVSATTSFKTYSRGYVASAYGTLRANEDAVVDPARTMEVEEVRVRAGARVTLAELLRALDGADLRWGTAPDAPSGTVYQGFRRLNRHIDLPVAATVAPTTDLVLTASTEGADVRFFLPLGATDVLRRAGMTSVERTRRLDASAFGRSDDEVTLYDRQYDALVRSTATLSGFTLANRAQLDWLVERFDALAAQTPTPYRLAQREIARVHRSVWRTKGFESLAEAVALAGGTVQLTPAPSTSMDVTPVAPSAPVPAPAPAPPIRLPDANR